MNKRKFFATVTLVAFGASMVPAMAFGAGGESAEGTLAINGTHADTTRPIGFTEGGSVGAKVRPWLDSTDTIELKIKGGASFAEGKDFTYKIAGVGENYADLGLTQPGFVLDFNGHWLAGNVYELTVKDSSSNKTLVLTSPEVTERVKTAITTSSSSTSVTMTLSGTAPNGAAVDYTSGVEIYKLTADNWPYIREATDGAALMKIAVTNTENNVTIPDGTKLEPGYYGVSPMDGEFIMEVFEFTQTNADNVAAAAKTAQGKVDTAKKAIETQAKNITISSSTGNVLTTVTGNGDVSALSVKSVSGGLVGVVATSADSATKKDGAISLGDKDSATGDITFTFTVDGTPCEYTVSGVTISKVTGDFDAAIKAYADAYLTDYVVGATGERTAKLTLKVGDTINTDSFKYLSSGTVETGTISLSSNGNADLKDYLSISDGKVTAAPEGADYTTPADKPMKITFTKEDNATNATIAVTVTVKADGSSTAKEEAAQAVATASTTFNELVAAAGTEVDDTEFAAILNAYMQLLQAYMAYIQIV